MDRAPRNQKGNGLRMYGPGYRGDLSLGMASVTYLVWQKIAWDCKVINSKCENSLVFEVGTVGTCVL